MSPERSGIRNVFIDRSPQVLVFLTRPLPPVVPFDKIIKVLRLNGLWVNHMDFTTAGRELEMIQTLLGFAERRTRPTIYHWQGKNEVVAQSIGDINLHGIMMTSNARFDFYGLRDKLSPHLGSFPLCSPSFNFLAAYDDTVK